MSRTRPGRPPRPRSWAALVALVFVGACGAPATVFPPAPVASPGQPAGTVVVPAGTDLAGTVQRLQDAIVADGGAVTAVVDNTADAGSVGVEIPPSVVVVGGRPSAQAPFLAYDQRSAVNLPTHYLVRAAEGEVSVTYNAVDFTAAVSGVDIPPLTRGLREHVAAVTAQVSPGTPVPPAAPLIGVNPADRVLSVFGSNDVPVTVQRLRRAAALGSHRVVADVDMAAGAEGAGPAVRPTALVLVSSPEIEAPLVAAAPTFGLELPMRFVVWVDALENTRIGYPDVRRLAERHGIPAGDPGLAGLAVEADRMARFAAEIIFE